METCKVVAIAENDEISILYTTPVSLKSGATKSNAISVEDYNYYNPTAKMIIDLSDDVKIVRSSFSGKRRRRFYTAGESSNSKKPDDSSNRRRRRRSFICEICTDEKAKSESFRINGCHHYYCKQCMRSYVASKLRENNISSINCPVPRCRGVLEPQHCRTILPKEVFERWGDALCEAMILGAEKLYCPYKDCSALVLIDSGEDKDHNKRQVQSECPECNRLFCVPSELADDDEEDERKRWLRCPNCRFYVSKTTAGRCSCRCRD